MNRRTVQFSYLLTDAPIDFVTMVKAAALRRGWRMFRVYVNGKIISPEVTPSCLAADAKVEIEAANFSDYVNL